MPSSAHPRVQHAVVLACVIAVGAVAVRLSVAAATFGTFDVVHWIDFTDGARRAGPLGIYDVDWDRSYYNHGPLTSWALVLLAHAHEAGASIPFAVRAVPSLADGVSVLVLFQLLRRERGDAVALTAAAVYAVVPVTVTIAGFHGNTDPLFMALVLWSVLSLTSSARGWTAGVAFGLAISIKVVPVVMLPVLLVLAARRGTATLRRFLIGGAVVFVVLWLPVLVTRPGRFVGHVLLYPGVDLRQWGLSQFALWSGVPVEDVVTGGGAARFLVVLVAAMGPALLARRRHDLAVVGLPLCVFLLLSPAFSMQYLVWAAAPALMVARLRFSVPFLVCASLLTTLAYSAWNAAPPWGWYASVNSYQPPAALFAMVFTWFLLARVCWWGVRASPASTAGADGTSGGRRADVVPATA